MKPSVRWGGFAAVLVVLVLGYAAWRSFANSNAAGCYACNRAIHAHSKTVALVNGRPRRFCCPACALSQHEQTGKPVNIIQLTSFLTGTSLSPDHAYVVKASDVNMCERTKELLSPDKRPADLRYDRCAPSLLAFAQREDAVEFARQHGGEVLPFSQAAVAFAK
jgi:hypothetical protein